MRLPLAALLTVAACGPVASDGGLAVDDRLYDYACSLEYGGTVLQTSTPTDFEIEVVDGAGWDGLTRIESWDCIDPSWWTATDPRKVVQIYAQGDCGTFVLVEVEHLPCDDVTGPDAPYRDFDGDGLSPEEGDCDDDDPTTGGDLDGDGTSDCVDDDGDGLSEEDGDCNDQSALQPNVYGNCWGPGISHISAFDDWVTVAAGEQHTCGLRANGRLLCWGNNESGQLDAPDDVVVVGLTAGHGFTCAWDAAGEVSCWGISDEGQLEPPSDALDGLDAGASHVCGLAASQRAECWGRDVEDQATPPDIDLAVIASGELSTCALSPAGYASCWGDDLGEDAAEGLFTDLAMGDAFACGLRVNGDPECWGESDDGQTSPPAITATAIDAGAVNACALTGDGAAICWGGDRDGQASPPDSAFGALALGSAHGCGIRTDGFLECWGYDLHGQATPP